MKFSADSRIVVVKDHNTSQKVGKVGTVVRIDGNDPIYTYKIVLDQHTDNYEWVREEDIEFITPPPVASVKSQNVKEQLVAIEAAVSSIKATLGL